VDETIRAAASVRLDSLTKPRGSLGRLEPLIAQVCAIQRTLAIEIHKPLGIVFAGDHGIAESGVSAYPREVTVQMVSNYLNGGAAISVLAKHQQIELWIVDAGVDGECGPHPRFIEAKVRRGTRNFANEPAMTAAECLAALTRGWKVVERLAREDSNTLVLGEMGIGNTASSALLMHGLTGRRLSDCVDRGTGLDDAGLDRKRAILEKALSRCPTPQEPMEWLTEFGGYEIAMLTGAVLAGAANRMVILIDGFTGTIAAALASRWDPNALAYCVFGHCSQEHAHRALLDYLQVEPLLDLGMRLGEASGAALALPILRSAVHLFTEMATFEGAGVSDLD
jgi:nicotinate-nucleotide--dimethylbenzimidazole phosphoribosyltransferase